MPRTKLTEAAGFTLDPRGTGKFLIKIIDVGEGSSAHYTADALRLAATERVFPAGTHMYLDHAGEAGRGAYGERSVRDLVSVTSADAWFDEAAQALVAEATAVGGHGDALESLAQYVGLSISALAEVDPPAEGSSKPTVRRFAFVESVDWVTHAGRGGQVLSILESMRPAAIAEAAGDDRRDQLRRALNAAYPRQGEDYETAAWLLDFDDVARLCWYNQGRECWQQTYIVADDDQSATLTGDRLAVRPVTHYVPVSSGGATTTHTQENSMPEISQQELDRLREAEAKVGTLTSERDAATQRAQEAEAKLAEAEHARKVDKARKAATDRVHALTEGVAPQMAARVRDQIVASITEAELPADLDQRITAALEAERTYLSSLSEGRLTGFGASEAATTTPQRTTNAWGQPITQEA